MIRQTLSWLLCAAAIGGCQDRAADSPKPQSQALSASPIAITFQQTSAWSGGYGANIIISNNGGAPIDGWTLSFTTSDAINSLWNGALSGGAGGTGYSVGNASWNGVIAVGGSMQLGYGADTPAGSTAAWNPPASATLNGLTVATQLLLQSPTNGGPGASAITIAGADGPNKSASQITAPQGTSTWVLGGGTGAFTVDSNNPALAEVSVDGSTLSITSRDPAGGRAGLRISSGGQVRYVGLRIKDQAGAVPGFPSYLSVGLVSEDSDLDLGMFRGFGSGDSNTRVTNRYIYLNGGPVNGWYTWGTAGARARNYVVNSLRLGIIPTFVYYNIADGGESYQTDLAHVQDAGYMSAYFQQLQAVLDIVNEEAPDEPVMFVMEPDFIGYLMQNAGLPADQIMAQASAATTAMRLDDAGNATSAPIWTGADPIYPNTVQGVVMTINHLIHRSLPRAQFGWQINVWSSLSASNQLRVPRGLMKITDPDQYGFTAGRQLILAEAAKVYDYYRDAGILSEGATFISFDKYGLDAVGAQSSAATDPNSSYWFYNADHWSNYLSYVGAITAAAGKPAALWQLPVGRINSTSSRSPNQAAATPLGSFADLDNSTNRYEDSTATYFFGDIVAGNGGTRLGYFSQNSAADPLISSTANTFTWGSHMQAALAAGVFNIMFGDGVGISTKARPLPSGEIADGGWLMANIQRYLAAPVSSPSAPWSFNAGDAGIAAAIAASAPPPGQVPGDGGDGGGDQGHDGGTGPVVTSVQTAPTDSPASKVLGISLRVDSAWSGGFTGTLTVTNLTGYTLKSGGFSTHLYFPAAFACGQAFSAGPWNMQLTPCASAVTLTPMSWQADIAPGQTATTGFGGLDPAALSGITFDPSVQGSVLFQ